MRPHYLVAFLVCTAAGCGPRVPTQSEARAAFAERRARIEAFEESVFFLIATASQDPEPTPTQMKHLVVGAGALGFQGFTGLPSVPPCVGGTGPDEVPPEQGFSEGKYAVGYGLYQTAWNDGTSHGDGDFHPGIVVRWRLGEEDGPLKEPVTLCMLLDGTPRPE